MEASSDQSEATRGRWLTLANLLTAVRMTLAPLCALAVVDQAFVRAAWIFAAAVASDLADGPIARKRGESSALGGLLDHGTDAGFVALGLGALGCLDLVPGLLPWLVLGSFTQYALDSRALAGQPLRASALGRANGIAYYVLFGTAIVRNALGIAWPSDALLLAFGWLLVATTLLSMIDRAWALVRRGAAGGPA